MPTIRPYSAADSDTVIRIWRAANEQAHSFLSADFMNTAEGLIRDTYVPMAETWLAEIDRKPVAFIALIGNEVGGFFTDPAYQGRGAGRALMDLAASKRDRLELDVFSANPFGQRFYTTYGFVSGEERLDEPSGFPVTRMTFEVAA